MQKYFDRKSKLEGWQKTREKTTIVKMRYDEDVDLLRSIVTGVSDIRHQYNQDQGL